MRLDAGSCGAGGKYILVNDYEQVSGAEEGINTNPGPYYRFYTRKLKYVDGVTCDGYSYLKDRTLLDVDQGPSTTRLRVWSW
jgi:hypothetical protein